MKLKTIQPETVYQGIQETGVYHCDFSKSIRSRGLSPGEKRGSYD